ncbi:unnamed protein product, partial [Amoebophrya sp. A120]
TSPSDAVSALKQEFEDNTFVEQAGDNFYEDYDMQNFGITGPPSQQVLEKREGRRETRASAAEQVAFSEKNVPVDASSRTIKSLTNINVRVSDGGALAVAAKPAVLPEQAASSSRPSRYGRNSTSNYAEVGAAGEDFVVGRNGIKAAQQSTAPPPTRRSSRSPSTEIVRRPLLDTQAAATSTSPKRVSLSQQQRFKSEILSKDLNFCNWCEQLVQATQLTGAPSDTAPPTGALSLPKSAILRRFARFSAQTNLAVELG